MNANLTWLLTIRRAFQQGAFEFALQCGSRGVFQNLHSEAFTSQM